MESFPAVAAFSSSKRMVEPLPGKLTPDRVPDPVMVKGEDAPTAVTTWDWTVKVRLPVAPLTLPVKPLSGPEIVVAEALLGAPEKFIANEPPGNVKVRVPVIFPEIALATADTLTDAAPKGVIVPVPEPDRFSVSWL
jgi:hypothetical protein